MSVCTERQGHMPIQPHWGERRLGGLPKTNGIPIVILCAHLKEGLGIHRLDKGNVSPGNGIPIIVLVVLDVYQG